MTTTFKPAASSLAPLSPKDAEAMLKTQLAANKSAAMPTSVETQSPPEKIAALIANIETVILGKREAIKYALVGLLARGHILIEDVPGVGKTMLARALAKSIDCEFRRIQFTPDLLPSDVVGVSIFEPKEHHFKFHPGPLFANVILADEINRTTPRTQSALLEAMSDFQVSVDGVTHKLPDPFIVLATQNPIEYAGTYPLPESQLDRFLLRITMGYPDRDSEHQALKAQRLSHPLDVLKPVITIEETRQLQEITRAVRVDDALVDYILEIASRTREHRNLSLGVSIRGSLMLERAAQAYALIHGRHYCRPDDIKRLAHIVLGHRIIEKGRDAGASRKDSEAILSEILEEVPVPI